MDVPRLSWAMREKGEGEGRAELGAAARRSKVQDGRVTKMSGLYVGKSLWGKGSWSVQGGGGGCQPWPVTGRQ